MNMPFGALYDDELVCSLDYSADEWVSLKRDKNSRKITLCPHCYSELTYVTGDYDTFFYRHPPGVKCPYLEKLKERSSSGESRNHISMKRCVRDICKKLNIPVELEVYHNGIIADLLIGKSRKIALEIQFSKITLFKLIDRNIKYLHNWPEVIPFWLLSEYPKRKFSEYGMGKRMTLYNNYLCNATLFNRHPDTNEWVIWITKDKSSPVASFISDIVFPEYRDYFERIFYICSQKKNTPLIHHQIMTRQFLDMYSPDAIPCCEEIKHLTSKIDDRFIECYYTWPDSYDGTYPDADILHNHFVNHPSYDPMKCLS